MRLIIRMKVSIREVIKSNPSINALIFDAYSRCGRKCLDKSFSTRTSEVLKTLEV